MQQYILRRLIGAVFVIFLTGTFMFFMLRRCCGGPGGGLAGT